jgi:uncharacterized protein
MTKENTLIFILIAGLVIVCALFAFNSGMPDTLTIAENEQRETVTVSESVELETAPNEVEIYLEIETEADTAKDAKNKNAKIEDAVRDALDDYGIDNGQLETTSYYLNEQQKWDRDKEEYISTGWRLSHILRVTTDDVKNAGEIIDEAVNAGATGINNVNFGLTNAKEREVKAEALAEAAQKAESKAQAIVDAVGVELGDFVSITESSYYNSYPRYAYATAEMAMDSSAGTSISPQEVSVSGTVTLTYEIEQ